MAQMTAEEIARKRYLSDEKEAAEKQALIERKAAALDKLEAYLRDTDLDLIVSSRGRCRIGIHAGQGLLALAEALPEAEEV